MIIGFLYPLPTLTTLTSFTLGIRSPHLAYIAVAFGGITRVGNFWVKLSVNSCPDLVLSCSPATSLGLNDVSIVASSI